MQFYVGTYTRNTNSDGIYRLVLNDDLSVQSLTCVAEADNPSWLIRDAENQLVYCVNEVSDYANSGGAISVYQETGYGLLQLQQQVPTMGADPCHLLATDASIICTNYSSGSAIRCGLTADGSLSTAFLTRHEGSGPDEHRQASAHAHSSIVFNNQLIVADLGIDELVVYRQEEEKLIRQTEITMPAGCGPRLMVADETTNTLYVICELSNTIEVVSLEEDVLSVRGSTSTLPEDFSGESYTAHLAISSDGRYLYGSNRGHDSIVVMSLEGDLPQPIQWVSTEGRHPRHFTLSEDGRFLLVANRDDDNIVLFKRDSETGLLTDLAIQISVPAPVCLVETNS